MREGHKDREREKEKKTEKKRRGKMCAAPHLPDYSFEARGLPDGKRVRVRRELEEAREIVDREGEVG